MCTLLFAAFMLIQFVALRLANQAGRGYLATEQQEYVYLYIQMVVIEGILTYWLFHRFFSCKACFVGVLFSVLSVCAVGVGIMLFCL